MENRIYEFFPDDLIEKHTKNSAGVLCSAILSQVF